MKDTKLILLIALIASNFPLFAQVELGGDEEKPKKEKVKEEKAKDEKVVTKDGNTEVYVLTNWSRTSRVLETNEGPFGDTLGQRAYETSLNKWSFGIGFRSALNEHFSIQAGVSFMRNGESYSFEEPDTLFKYTTTYSYIAMPIKGLYTLGDELKLLVGGGITPQLFTSYLQEQEWRDKVDATGNETIKQKNGYSTFVLSAAVNIGVQYQFSDNFSILFMPEYRIQLTDSYVVTDSYNHFARAFGFDLGLTFKL
jgi:opacity protein-like surface antigen